MTQRGRIADSSASFSLRQLRYFVATSEALSITAAAAKLNISQPSISAAIAELEAIFGTTLFIRHHARGMSLTTTGYRLAKEARILLRHAEEVLTIAGELTEVVAGRIAVGCLVTIAPMVLPKVTLDFQNSFPGVEVEPSEADQGELLERVNKGMLDCALTYDFNVPADFEFTALADLPPHVLLPSTHPLLRRKTITLSALCAEQMVLLDLPLSREYFMGLFATEGKSPTVIFRSPHGDVVRAMVASGFGYTLWNFPLQSSQALDGKQFRVRPLDGHPRPARLGIAALKTSRPRKIVQAFKDYCAAKLPAMATWPQDDGELR
jgi:DNA-binding transcriptional LysR family regulator